MDKIKKADILDKAKLTLEDIFKGELTLVDKNWTSNQDNEVDGYLLFNNVKFPFIVLTRPTQPRICRSANYYSKEKNILFVLDYADSRMVNFFTNNNLFFVDTAGNCYVNLPDFKIAIEGRKNVFGKLPDIKMAFQEEGLKLIYQLLIEPELTSETFDTIALKMNTTWAYVFSIFKELESEGYATVQKLSKDTTMKGSLSNVELLITNWAVSYVDVLRPKIHRGYFRSLTADLETRIISDNSKNEIYFGGQFGARYLNNGITAQEPILFSNIRLRKMVEKYKIVPIAVPQYQQERVEILEVFWNTERLNNNKLNKKVKGIVDPILIYADLMMSSDSRSRQAAQNILENEIRDKFIRYNFQW